MSAQLQPLSGEAGPAAPPLLLRRDEGGGVHVLTLNRPAARNALSLAMLDALAAAFGEIAADSAVRAVVLAAEGPVFSAGHDLRELTARRADPDGGRAFFETTMTRCAEVMQAITALPQPVIAAVQGVATAAGCQLVATCDLAVASTEARFCTPGVDIGLFCSTPAVALSRAVPPKPAMEMLLLGEMIPAEEARRIHLVNRVVPPAEVMPTALDLARRIAARSALTVRLGKRNFYRQLGRPLAEAYACSAAAMVENLMAEDAAEGIGAFLGKRKPVWKDR
ncbi:enoyl-CoA hydratase [Caldovatus aquaticus]|uniref:Enoyl-CoA hydratase domain-containing protein 3, mitochondrial n=1 Tax=Caldovatus aquaticus TaxID=2865671 RepID=A0ABS7F3G6_9PROT|nr:enoyl-CoA hydratase [Caldovatus aquaticus]MBW8270151.1 enoyl-CoA hydratase [Caldovatus aquaticus]